VRLYVAGWLFVVFAVQQIPKVLLLTAFAVFAAEKDGPFILFGSPSASLPASVTPGTAVR
jgi:hypothetical protein